MIRLSEITPETTYADIKEVVEKNLSEGWGVPYEGIILMARTLDRLAKELAQTQARLEDAQGRLPLEDEYQERHRLRRMKAGLAAIRMCSYLVRCRPNYMYSLVNEDKIEADDFLELLTYNGISTEPYEG